MKRFSLFLITATCFGQGTPDTFIRLRDVPHSYAGQSGKFPKVNSTETGLEFVSGGGGSFSGLYTDLDFTASNLTSIVTRNFTDLTAKPTTLTGYGITDAVPNTRTVNSHALSANVTVTAGDVGAPSGSGTSTGTNTGDQVVPANTTGTASQWFSAYNSTTGAFTKSQPTFTDLSAHPTTIAGYGITDFNSLGDARWQPLDADLTSWALITRASGFDTFTATPSSANLRGVLTDENGTGVALFNGATTPDFTTGFTIGTAAGTGKIVMGDGTKFAASTATWPSTFTAGYELQTDGTNVIQYPGDLFSTSTSQQTWAASEAYLAGSTITIAAGDWKAKGTYHCTFDVTKTSVAGTATPIIKFYMGTLGTTSDTLISTLTFPSQTAVADNGVFEVWGTFRTVGSGTSAVLQTRGRITHNLSITGLSVGVSPMAINTSAGFNSTTATKIGISATFGTSFVGTTQLVFASLMQP